MTNPVTEKLYTSNDDVLYSSNGDILHIPGYYFVPIATIPIYAQKRSYHINAAKLPVTRTGVIVQADAQLYTSNDDALYTSNDDALYIFGYTTTTAYAIEIIAPKRDYAINAKEIE